MDYYTNCSMMLEIYTYNSSNIFSVTWHILYATVQ